MRNAAEMMLQTTMQSINGFDDNQEVMMSTRVVARQARVHHFIREDNVDRQNDNSEATDYITSLL